MSEKKILISGKEIEYGNYSDEKLLSLYNQLLERQINLSKKIQKYIENGQIKDIDINNINVQEKNMEKALGFRLMDCVKECTEIEMSKEELL